MTTFLTNSASKFAVSFGLMYIIDMTVFGSSNYVCVRDGGLFGGAALIGEWLTEYLMMAKPVAGLLGSPDTERMAKSYLIKP